MLLPLLPLTEPLGWLLCWILVRGRSPPPFEQPLLFQMLALPSCEGCRWQKAGGARWGLESPRFLGVLLLLLMLWRSQVPLAPQRSVSWHPMKRAAACPPKLPRLRSPLLP